MCKVFAYHSHKQKVTQHMTLQVISGTKNSIIR